MDLLVHDKKTKLSPSKIIGAGGEAEIYDIGKGEVAKIFKQPDHPDFSLSIDDQKNAKKRIDEHQKKLVLWPNNLPSGVIGPTSLVTDSSKKAIYGYTMKFLSGMEVLLKYGERKYRESHGISADNMLEVFKNLHVLVSGVHKSGVVIGDFNDLNVLVDSSMRTHLVDADSMQFGGFYCRLFTAKFVDPLNCDFVSSLSFLRPHNPNSDWYAYNIMLMQSLLFVGPYDGVHVAANGAGKLKDWQRIQKRVTVFHPEIRYPKPANHFSILPLDLLDHFSRVFEKDARNEFPVKVLSEIHFTSCPKCKKVHARSSCPDCQPTPEIMVKEIITKDVEALKVLDTFGRILYATMQGGILKCVYHENNVYYRENKRKLIDGAIDPNIRFRLNDVSSVIAKDGQCILVDINGKHINFMSDIFRGRVTVVDANNDSVFVVQGGILKRFKSDDFNYSDNLRMVFTSQTMLWVGDELGFTFSRAGGFTETYVFLTKGNTVGVEVNIDRITGQVLDATTVFSKDHAWFFISIDQNGQRINRAYMFDKYGKFVGKSEAIAGDDSWLGNIKGKCAHGKQLFCPTDDGIVRVESTNGILGLTKVFSGTTQFVDSSTQILFGNDGIYAVDSQRIWRLKMK